MNPEISIIICTYNGRGLIENCLESITSQNYMNFEVLCLDGGSDDGTKEIIKRYSKEDKRIKLLDNPNKLPEGEGNGKWLGCKKANGKIIGFIDQDNILQDKGLFSKVKTIFDKEESNTFGILGGLTHDLKDKPIVRFVSLVGTDSFFAYRSIDFLRNISLFKRDIKIKSNNMSRSGGNCFFYKKADLDSIGGYTQDVLVEKNLINKEKNNLIILNNATKHFAEKSLFSLAKKKFYWSSKFLDRKDQERFNYLPKTDLERKKFFKNLVFNLTVLPNLYYSFKLFGKSKDLVSFVFPVMAFLNTSAYFYGFVREKLSS